MIKSIFEHDEQPQGQSPKQNAAETADILRNELEEMNAADEKKSVAPDAEREIRQVFSKIVELPHTETHRFSDNSQVFASPIRPEISEPESSKDFRTENNSPLNQIFSGNQPEKDFIESPPSEVFQTPRNPTAPPIENTEFVAESPIVIHHEPPQSLSAAETIRQSGLAWSAAIGLFGSVVFMMILGWIVDVLTGASPIGLVGGIVIGAGIGFYQFFRVSSMIFKK